jgi:hypothetical protein
MPSLLLRPKCKKVIQQNTNKQHQSMRQTTPSIKKERDEKQNPVLKKYITTDYKISKQRTRQKNCNKYKTGKYQPKKHPLPK